MEAQEERRGRWSWELFRIEDGDGDDDDDGLEQHSDVFRRPLQPLAITANGREDSPAEGGMAPDKKSDQTSWTERARWWMGWLQYSG